jgi:Fibronectin type III domain
VSYQRLAATFVVCLLLFAARATAAATLTLAWDPPSDDVTTGYVISYGTSSGTYVEQIDVGLVTSYVVPALADGTTYYFAVSAYNAAGDFSPPSAEVSGTTPTDGGGGNGGGSRRKPKHPRNLAASLRDDSFIDLSWQPSEDVVSAYRVELGTRPNRTDVSSFTTGRTTSFTIGDLPLNSNQYYVRVRGVDENGPGDTSNEVLVAGSGGADAPRRLAREIIGSTVRLTWDPPSNATGITNYLIEAGTGPSRSDLGTVQTGARSFTSPALPNGTYFVRVRAMRAAGAGAASNETVFEIGTNAECRQAPGTPNFAASAAGTLVQLMWSQGPGEAPSGYVLDVGSMPGLRDIAAVQFGSDTKSLSTPAPNGTYSLRLSAVNACGASHWAPESTVTVGGPPPALPDAPAALTEMVVGRSVTLTWSPAATGGDPARYVIEASDMHGNVLVTLDTGNLATSFVHGDVPPGRYVVRVKAANAAGVSEASNAVTITVTP